MAPAIRSGTTATRPPSRARGGRAAPRIRRAHLPGSGPATGRGTAPPVPATGPGPRPADRPVRTAPGGGRPGVDGAAGRSRAGAARPGGPAQLGPARATGAGRPAAGHVPTRAARPGELAARRGRADAARPRRPGGGPPACGGRAGTGAVGHPARCRPGHPATGRARPAPARRLGAARACGTARHISNRAADPAPLTEAELFPGKAVGGYPLVKTQATPDCAGVAIGEPAKILAGAGCTQMVRATLLSPDKVYVVTAGLVNLESEDRAQQANEGIRTAVGAQKGRFTGFVVSGVSEVFTTAATQLGWDVRGHFLGYCVVARADGKPLDGNDPGGRRIIDDLVEKYLIGTVVQARVSPPSSAPAPAGRTGAPKPSATRK